MIINRKTSKTLEYYIEKFRNLRVPGRRDHPGIRYPNRSLVLLSIIYLRDQMNLNRFKPGDKRLLGMMDFLWRVAGNGGDKFRNPHNPLYRLATEGFYHLRFAGREPVTPPISMGKLIEVVSEIFLDDDLIQCIQDYKTRGLLFDALLNEKYFTKEELERLKRFLVPAHYSQTVMIFRKEGVAFQNKVQDEHYTYSEFENFRVDIVGGKVTVNYEGGKMISINIEGIDIKIKNGKGVDTPKPLRKGIVIQGESYPCKYAYDILINLGNWLLKEGHLKDDMLPIRSLHRNRYLINIEPKHPDGTHFKMPKKLSNGSFLEIVRRVKYCIEHSYSLLESCHLDKTELQLVGFEQ